MTSLKTLFIITISAARLVIPGFPGALNLQEGAKQPGVRSFNIEVASDAVAAKGAKASVAVPEGLMAGKTVDLQIDTTAPPVPKSDASTTQVDEYWGSGRVVSGDQPKITKPGSIPPAPTDTLPDKSYAYWPRIETPPLDQDAATPGTYSLKTDYVGATSITLTQEQNFLDPIDITITDREPDLDKPIVIRWKPVLNAAGYVLKAYGGDDKRTIIWTSSMKPELSQGIEYRPISKDDQEKYIKEGVLIPSYVASCTIPSGIFKGSASVMLVMIAVGKDLVQTKDGIETQVIVRSTASIPLHNSPAEIPKSTPTKKAE